MLGAVAALVSAGCIVASGRRLAFAVSPTPYDPALLLRALGDGADPSRLGRLRDALERAPGHPWEREVLEAATASDASARGAMLGEQIIEADWATERWARVPRVCASIATSVGFLCAALLLIRSLGADAPLSPGGMDGVDAGQGGSGEILASALGALALGIVGTAFSVAVHLRARVVTRERRAAVDGLVDRLRALPIS